MEIKDLNIIMSLVLSLVGFIGINIKILIITKINHNNVNITDIDTFKERLDEINQISNQLIKSIKFQ